MHGSLEISVLLIILFFHHRQIGLERTGMVHSLADGTSTTGGGSCLACVGSVIAMGIIFLMFSARAGVLEPPPVAAIQDTLDNNNNEEEEELM